mmetsp:Transcript_54089/g.69486  ORF Transcript_54089/g.69486 Transcript_54089/m.69486 type:complete len:378 (+) Transcript_54089:104-1237(+)
MGGAPSIAEKAVEYQLTANQSTELVVIMKYLGLTWHEVDRIHASFNMMDLDATQSISRQELLESLGAGETKYAHDAFRVFDKNRDGSIDFVEFLVATTKLCCADHENICRFAFRMVDVDGSGEIERKELETIVQNIYGHTVSAIPHDGIHGWKQEKTPPIHNNKHGSIMPHKKPRRESVQVILNSLDGDKSGTLSIEEYIHAAHKFPQLIEPAFHMQQLLRNKVVNNVFWHKREKKIRAKFASFIMNKNKDVKRNSLRNYVRKFSNPDQFEKNGTIVLKHVQNANKKKEIKHNHKTDVKVHPHSHEDADKEVKHSHKTDMKVHRHSQQDADKEVKHNHKTEESHIKQDTSIKSHKEKYHEEEALRERLTIDCPPPPS